MCAGSLFLCASLDLEATRGRTIAEHCSGTQSGRVHDYDGHGDDGDDEDPTEDLKSIPVLI